MGALMGSLMGAPIGALMGVQMSLAKAVSQVELNAYIIIYYGNTIMLDRA